MSTVSRGVRNAFRNNIRSGGVTVILALSVGLALVMLLSLKTVQARITSVKANLGNTISISPAGFSNFSDANNALTTAQLDKVKQVPHVTKLVETLQDRLPTTGSSTPSFGRFADTGSNSTTSLTSPVKLNAGGNGGSGGGGGRVFIRGGGQLPAGFTPPVSVLGTTDPTSLSDQSITIKSGSAIDGSKDTSQALISTDMASKNNLKVGSTFQAYNATITVAGIFDSGSNGGQGNTVIFALPTIQRLSGQAGDVTSATATVDTVDNLASTTTAVQNALGSGNADVQNAQQQVTQAVQPLENIKTVSLYSLIGALVAGSVIIFLTMLMIVRERRREIGVLKAIGASNVTIAGQFVAEALTLTLAGAVVGVIGGLILSNPVLRLLVQNSTISSAGPGGGFGGGAGRGFARLLGVGGQSLQSLHAVVGYDILLYGLGAALLIAVLGSAVPAFLIAKVRPAEVMRGE
ncbi:MAG TPA: ABC transporter permease [Candidatus Saccharimonadia bacterium]|jgi:putative ABC transport system permease protein